MPPTTKHRRSPSDNGEGPNESIQFPGRTVTKGQIRWPKPKCEEEKMVLSCSTCHVDYDRRSRGSPSYGPDSGLRLQSMPWEAELLHVRQLLLLL